MTINTSDNLFDTARWIVDPTLGNGTHTTIGSALTSASSGQTIFIRPGTYTENLTLKAGVNITAYQNDPYTPNVTIVGTLTATFAGTASITGIRLQTNSANIISVSGASATNLYFENCYLNCTNFTGIANSSSGAGIITLKDCQGNLGTTGIAYFTNSNTNTLRLHYCHLFNSGSSTTSSTLVNASILEMLHTTILNQITTSNTAVTNLYYSEIGVGGGIAQTAMTHNSTTSGEAFFCMFISNTASAVSIGTGATFNMFNCAVSSTNTNAITGLGSLTYSGIANSATSSTINTTTTSSQPFQLGSYRANLQCAFLYYLATTQTNKTGNGLAYTLGSNALTKVFDQGSNMTTGGTFTAPITGIYNIGCMVTVTATTTMASESVSITTTSRTYSNGQYTKAGPTFYAVNCTSLCFMTAGDTATFTVTDTGEAGNTNSVFGGATLFTYIYGTLQC